jgi:hypothetical protein
VGRPVVMLALVQVLLPALLAILLAIGRPTTLVDLVSRIVVAPCSKVHISPTSPTF